MIFSALVFVVLLTLAATAHAGPLDGWVAGLIGQTPAYWIEFVALVSAALGLVSALIKDSKLHPLIRDVLNLLSSNWGAAKNDPGAN